VSVINPNETARSWQTAKRETAVQLYLSGVEGDSADLLGAKVAGFPLSLNVIPVTDWIDPEEISAAAAAVVQIDADTPSSIKRFQKLAQSTTTPLIAAAYDPPLSLVRSLVRSGAHDVVPLPLSIEDLETSLAPVADGLSQQQTAAAASTAKLVSVIKGVGGAGATALSSQLALRFAQSALSIAEGNRGDLPNSASSGEAWLALARARHAAGDAAAAREACGQAVRHLAATLDDAHPSLADARALAAILG